MHNLIIRLCVILISSLSFLNSPSFVCHAQDATEQDFTTEDYFEEGYRLYTQSEFEDAAAYLGHAASLNHPGAQELYADICYRQLDDEPHSYSEAAMWYLLAASGPYHDPDAASYLESILPGILKEDNETEQIKSIVRYWCLEDTLLGLKPLKPAQVNDYIIQKYQRNINRTTAQKLPYFFDKVMTGWVHCLFHRLDIPIDPPVPSPISSQESPILSSSPVQEESREVKSPILPQQHFLALPTFLYAAPVAFAYGPVYWDYWQAIREEVQGKKFLPVKKETLKIDQIYRFFLDAFHTVTQNNYGEDLSDLTHREYPWLWAGIQFWKKKNPKEKFSFTSHSEEELLNRLETFEEIDPQDIRKILNIIEIKESAQRIWPDKNDAFHHETLHISFQEHLRRYFQSSLSYQSELVQSVTQQFYKKVQKLTLDCSKDEDRATLQTPILMYYCKDLTLTQFTTNKECYNALYEGQRYFLQPHVTIRRHLWNDDSKYALRCEQLFEAIEAHGVSITIHEYATSLSNAT